MTLRVKKWQSHADTMARAVLHRTHWVKATNTSPASKTEARVCVNRARAATRTSNTHTRAVQGLAEWAMRPRQSAAIANSVVHTSSVDNTTAQQ